MQTNAELYLVGVIIDFRNLQTCVQFSHMLPRNVFILLGELRGDDTSYHLILLFNHWAFRLSLIHQFHIVKSAECLNSEYDQSLHAWLIIKTSLKVQVANVAEDNSED